MHKEQEIKQVAGELITLNLLVPLLVFWQIQLEVQNGWPICPLQILLLSEPISSLHQQHTLYKFLQISHLVSVAHGFAVTTPSKLRLKPLPPQLSTALDSFQQLVTVRLPISDSWLDPRLLCRPTSTVLALLAPQGSIASLSPSPPQWPPPSQPWASWALSPSQSVLSPCSSEQCPPRGH